MKNVLFFFVFALTSVLAQTPKGQPLILPKLNLHQEKTQETNLAQQEIIFRSLTEYLPDAVNRVKQESLVALRADIPHFEPERGLHHDPAYVAGFVPVGWDGYVLTCLHLLGEYPGVWVDKTYPVIVNVADGEEIFDTELAFLDYNSDLALFKVISPNEEKKIFRSKPAGISASTLPENFAKNPLPEKLYAFSFFTNHPALFYTIQIGPLRTITNALYPNMKFPVGIIQGGIEKGFSGGPVLAPDGMVLGVMKWTSPSFSYMILAETLHRFLESAKEAQKKEAKP